MRSGKCFVDAIDVGKRLRSINSEKVTALAESINTIGLQQPISVWSPDSDTLDLVAGVHRFEAVKKLGWEEINCVFVDLDDLDRQLWEIDENLMRADLSPAEMAEHTAKRAEIVKQKAAIVNCQVGQKPPGRPSEGQAEFDEDTAKATSQSVRVVRRDKARGEAIPADVLGKIQGTELDKGTYLDKLRKLPRDQQRAKVERNLEAIKRRKNDARLKEEEARRKDEAKEQRRRDFADMGELLDKKLMPDEVEWFLNTLAKYAGKTANDLRAWSNQ